MSDPRDWMAATRFATSVLSGEIEWWRVESPKAVGVVMVRAGIAVGGGAPYFRFLWGKRVSEWPAKYKATRMEAKG